MVKKKRERAVVRYVFSDDTVERISAEDAHRQIVRQHARALKSSDPRIREKGERLLNAVADAALSNHLDNIERSKSGSKGANRRWNGEESKVLKDIVENLSRFTDALGDYLDPSELWHMLFGDLDDAGLAPKEVAPTQYTYGGCHTITYDAFRKRVQRLRR